MYHPAEIFWDISWTFDHRIWHVSSSPTSSPRAVRASSTPAKRFVGSNMGFCPFLCFCCSKPRKKNTWDPFVQQIKAVATEIKTSFSPRISETAGWIARCKQHSSEYVLPALRLCSPADLINPDRPPAIQCWHIVADDIRILSWPWPLQWISLSPIDEGAHASCCCDTNSSCGDCEWPLHVLVAPMAQREGPQARRWWWPMQHRGCKESFPSKISDKKKHCIRHCTSPV